MQEGGVYPGYGGRVGTRVGAGEGYTGTQPLRLRYPYLVIFLRYEPTHGQMKAIPSYFMRFLRYGLRLTSQIPSFDPQIDLQMTLPVTLQTGPEMALQMPQIDPQISYGPE